MRVVIQRVSEASVRIDEKVKSSIGKGLMILAGFEEADDEDDLCWMAGKIVKLRIFEDSNNQMNLSIQDIQGDVLLVSQFTLYALVKKGNRPSFTRAAKPDVAIPLYNRFIHLLSVALNKPVYTGSFGADMQVALVNDGPVTIWIDSKNKE